MKRFSQIFKFLSPQDKKLKRDIRALIGFKPKDFSIFKLALQHKSISSTRNNERLEFLGDAILGSVIAVYLFRQFPNEDEGYLTQMRTKIVNNNHLSKLAVKIGLDKHIRANLNKNELYFSVTAKSLEALIGAIYLDKGFKQAKTFIIEKLVEQHLDIEELHERIISFKSLLVEYTQKEKKILKFKLVAEFYVEKEKVFKVQVLINDEVISEFQHYSKKKAEEQAAEIAFHILNPVLG